jgi:hypothetical protein
MSDKQEAKCPHSHLPIRVLKAIGKAVKKVGPVVAETVLTAAFKDLGAFQDR